MRVLGAYARGHDNRGRDNNLNLIRAGAATAVLVSHAWALTLGAGTPEPLALSTGKALGTWAVEVFFVISGFLIAASFARRPDVVAFLTARALRLFPGLFVSLVLVAYVMGPLVTALPLAEYLAHPEPANFLLRNMTLLFPAYTLPGVFETNPFPAVEGSIWTLVHEVACYGGILAMGVLGAFRRPAVTWACLGAYALLWLGYQAFGLGFHPRIDAFQTLSLPFALGTAFFALRDRLPMTAWALPLLWGPAILLDGTTAGQLLESLALAYSVMWLAYVPGGLLRAYNRIGDYSYGIYVYAFPLQGLMVWLAGPMDPWTNIALALPATLVCAVLSWHLVEAPAMALLRRPAAPAAR